MTPVDMLWIEFAAKVPDVDAKQFYVLVTFSSPDFFDENSVSEHAIGIAQERAKNFKFRWREMHFPIANSNLAIPEINLQTVGAKHRLFGFFGGRRDTAKRGAKTRKQFVFCKWFLDEVVSSGIQCGYLVLLTGSVGQDDNWKRVVKRARLSNHVDAVDIGQLRIKQN